MSNFTIDKNMYNSSRKEDDIDPNFSGDIGVAGGGSNSSASTDPQERTEYNHYGQDSRGDDSMGGVGTNVSSNRPIGTLTSNGFQTTDNPRLSYFKGEAKDVMPSDGIKILEKTAKLEFSATEIPPSFDEDFYAKQGANLANAGRSIMSRGVVSNTNVEEETTDACYFRLGSFVSIVPPEAIKVSVDSGANQIQGIRSASPSYTKSSFSQRSINVQLFFNGVEGINGIAVESPFGYPHYINGYRHLLGMFKCTPFVPIVNHFLNEGHGINNVALSAIQTSTVEGFPHTFQVQITLQEVNLTPYVGPDVLFDDTIIYPLFNFYVQRHIRDVEVGLDRVTDSHFKENLIFSTLNPDIVLASGMHDSSKVDAPNIGEQSSSSVVKIDGSIDLLDEVNYVEGLNLQNENASITNISVGFKNYMPSIQMSNFESPTFQYLGGGSASFTIEMETTDEAFIAIINQQYRHALELGRAYIKNPALGFLKLDNEVLAVNGIKYVLVTNITTETVPGFPGLFAISITGMGYDAGQKDREKFKSFRPFYNDLNVKGDGWFVGRNGTKSDLVMQNAKGMANKVLQDSAAEAKLMTTELYPDLRLPKYSTIDWALGEILKFNRTHGLSTDGIPSKLTRPKSISPGRGTSPVEYNGFVDPDFYVSYPFRPSLAVSADGVQRSTPDLDEEQSARYNSTLLKARDIYSRNEDKETTERTTSSYQVPDDLYSSTISRLLPQKVNAFEVVEPEYVPGFEPDSQVRIHHSHLDGDIFAEDGTVLDDTQLLIDKLNEWVRSTGGSSSDYSFEAYEGSFAGEALKDQPGTNTVMPTQIKKVTGIPYVDLALNRAAVKCGYIFGSDGQIGTEALIQQMRSSFGKNVNISASRQWIGRLCWDCSSFVSWALRTMGYNIPRTTSGLFNQATYPNIFEPVTRENAQLGDIFYAGGHVAIYLGNGEVVHARGSAYGIVVNNHSYKVGSGERCGLTSRVKNIKEMTVKFLEANPNFYMEEPKAPIPSVDALDQLNPNANVDEGTLDVEDEVDGDVEEDTLLDDYVFNPDNSYVGGLGPGGMIGDIIGTVRGGLTKDVLNLESSASLVTPTSASNRSSQTVSLGTFPSEPITVNGSRYNCSATNKWDSLVLKHSATYNLDPNMVKAIIMIESSGNEKAQNSCCYGLMQIHANAHKVSSALMLQADPNINQGCSIFDSYSKYSYVGLDMEPWVGSYNAGIGTAKNVTSGSRGWATETINYIAKFKVFYAVLLSSGGHYGNRRAPQVNGKNVDDNWIESAKNGNPTAENGGVLDSGSYSSSSSSGGGNSQVWFERTDSPPTLENSSLKNLSAGFIHKVVPTIFKIAVAGLPAFAISLAVKGLFGRERQEDEERYQRALRVFYDDNQVTPPGDVLLPGGKINTRESISPEEFGVGFLDNLSNKELHFDHSAIAKDPAFDNSSELISERMVVDMTEKGMQARLCKAFPSFMFVIIDEHDNWVKECKFWSNYYIYQNVLSIDVHSSKDTPVTTAKISLSNLHRNIRAFKSTVSSTDLILGSDKKLGGGDSDFAWYNQLSYKLTGSLIAEEVTQSLIDIRNELHEELFLREGCRIHIRTGYGSNPANYATLFSGHIYELEESDTLVTIAAQSDGVELVSSVVTDRTTATTKDLGLPEEPCDLVAGLLCNRSNEFLYSLTGGREYIDNTYGISHFGLYLQGKKEGWLPFTWAPDSYNDPESRVAGGLMGGIAGALAGAAGGSAVIPGVGTVVGGVVGGIAGGGVGVAASKFVRRTKYEYDIVKNIHKGTYDGKPIYHPQVLWWDGETNFRFFCYDRTPWDLFKLSEKIMPEFVAYPRPFGFEYRLFYGLPWWLCKYRYERNDSTNNVHEFAKTFSQFHTVTSAFDIVDNQLGVSSRGLITNLVGIYNLGGDIASTPVIMSDWRIDRSRQKHANIDTSSTQDYGGKFFNFGNKVMSNLGAIDNGRHNAIRIALCELMENWRNTYRGAVICLGKPEVLPYDYLYIDDEYTGMLGLVMVRETVHSFNMDTGFTTSIFPGLLATNTLDLSGFKNMAASLFGLGATVTAYIKSWSATTAMVNGVAGAITSSKTIATATATVKSWGIVAKIKSLFVGAAGTGGIKGILSSILAKVTGVKVVGPVVGSAVAFFTKAFTVVKGAVLAIGGVFLGGATLIGVAKAAIIAAATAVVASFGMSLLRNITDRFTYRDCINVYPIMRNGTYMIAGASGQQTLVPSEHYDQIIQMNQEES